MSLQACIEAKFAGVADTRERAAASGRAMREAKVVKPCPLCKLDLAEFLKGAQVNTDMASIIGNLQRAAARLADGEEGGAGGEDEDEEGGEEEEEQARAGCVRISYAQRRGHDTAPASDTHASPCLLCAFLLCAFAA